MDTEKLGKKQMTVIILVGLAISLLFIWKVCPLADFWYKYFCGALVGLIVYVLYRIPLGEGGYNVWNEEAMIETLPRMVGISIVIAAMLTLFHISHLHLSTYMGIYAPVLGFATPALIAPVELFFESVSFVVWSAFH